MNPWANASTQETTHEDRYGVPENELEIEVGKPEFHGEGRNKYVDYEIVCNVLNY